MASSCSNKLNTTVDLINYNGTLVPASQALLTADNRGFRYGDGLFETMLVQNGRIRLGDYHFQRLFSGMRILRFELPSLFTPERLEQQILEVAAANRHVGRSRARLIVFRGDGGLFDLVDSMPSYIIQASPLPDGSNGWNETGLAIDVFPDGRKSCDLYSGLKSNNYLLYVLAAFYARERHLNDCLVLNSHGRVADSTIANLFYIKDDQFYTPPLSEGGVAGVMRRYLLESLSRAGFVVSERAIYPDDLKNADEVFLTNALKGINWVSSFQDSSYTHGLTAMIFKQLIQNL
jgi:branched-chain amino acid aminotransferase